MKHFLLSLCLLCTTAIFAQDFSNKGKEFYLAYCYHVGMLGGGAPVMTLYMTSDVNTTYEVYSGGVLTAAGGINAGQVISSNVSTSYYINDEGLFTNKAIYVKFSSPSVIYAYITRSAASGATLVLPVNVLGKEYISSNFTQNSNEDNSNSFLTIVAVEDNTNVEITPAADTKGGWLAGSVNTVVLNKGQIYQILGKRLTASTTTDLSGTKVRAISGGMSSCKRIAVFSGAGKINIGNNAGSADNLYQQLYPFSSWGKKYITVPSFGKPFNYYRIYKNTPTLNLTVNGAVVPLASFTAAGFYQFTSTTPNVIVSNEPISVAQYFTTAGVSGNNNPYDPDMIMLNPVEQNIANVTLVSSNVAAASPQHHIHCVVPVGGTSISSFRFDGLPVAATSFVPVPGDPNYNYLYISNVAQGFHTLSCDTGFNAIAYGYGNAESYGYSAGTNIKDIYQFLSIGNPNAAPTETDPTACVGSPFKFKVTLPYQPSTITWNFGGLFANEVVSMPIADSVYTLGGRILRRFTLPLNYTINVAGVYPIKVLTDNPTSDGCSGEQQIEFNLSVFDAPIPSFTWTHTGCITDTVFFRENSVTPKPTYKWWWDFDDATTSNVKNPAKKFATPGTFNVKMRALTTVGCFTRDTIIPITITSVPVALFTISATKCPGVPVAFTDASTSAVGPITSWEWNFGDGTGVFPVASSGVINHTFTNAGPYTVRLTVKTASGCTHFITQNIVINAKPIASYTLPGGICLPTGLAIFNNNSSIAGGEALTHSWTFGDGVGVSTATSPNYNYNGTGPFVITLTTTSANGCVDDSAQTLNSVYPAPLASFTAPAETCLNAATLFTSTSTAGAGSGIAEYYWDNGSGAFALATPSAASPNQSLTFMVAGTPLIRHFIKTDRGCFSDTVSKPITVLAPPVASINAVAPLCSGTSITFNNTSTTPAGSNITAGVFNPGDGSADIALTNTMPFTYTYAMAGNYTAAIKVTNNKGCESAITNYPVTIFANPAPAFTIPTACLISGSANVTFTNTSTVSGGGALSYVWTFGDAALSTPANPNTSTAVNGSHIYTTATPPYSINLQATSANGCIANTTIPFTTIYPQPIANFTVPAEVCFGVAVPFTNTSNALVGTITNYNWVYGDATADNGPAFVNPTHIYPNAIAYNPTLTITTSNGCVSAPVSKPVNYLPPPVANFTVGSPACEGNIITFTNTSTDPSGNAITSCVFTPGNGGAAITINNTMPFTYTYATGGTYNATFEVTNSKGCKSALTPKQVIVNVKPVPNFTIPNACLVSGSANVTFTNTSTISSGAALTYVWTFGDAALSTPANPNTSTAVNGSHIYTTATPPYSINLQATSANGCIANTTIPFTTIYPQPIANFTVPAEVCFGVAVPFTNTSNALVGTISNYNWAYGDATADNGPAFVNPTHIYPNAIAYNPTLTITTSNGCVSAPVSKPINYLPLPIANFTVSLPTCEGNIITFTNTSTDPSGNTITTCTFTPGDGSAAIIINNTLPFTYTYATGGTYNATFSVTNNKGCVSAITPKPVVVNVKPTPNFTIPVTCLVSGSGSTIFTNTSTITDGSVLTYLWNFDNATNATPLNPNTSTSTNGSHNYSAANTYNVNLVATSSTGCSKPITKPFSTLSQPLANFTVPAEVCDGLQVNFTDASTPFSGTIANWLWNFGDGSPTSALQNPTHTYATAGNYNVTLTITTSNGCLSAPFSKPVLILTLPTPTYTISTPNCLNQAIIFNDNTALTNAGAITNYYWSLGDASAEQNLTNSNPFNYTYSPTGTYNSNLFVKTAKGCFSDTTFTPVTINPLPVVYPILPEICLLDPLAQFGDTSKIADATEAGFTYLWTFGDANATPANPNTSTIKNATHKYIATGSYNVSLTVTSVNGCSVKKDTSFFVNGTVPVSAIQILNAANLCSNRDVQIRNSSTVDVGTITKLIIEWDLLGAPAIKTIDNDPTPGKIYAHTYPPFATPLTKDITVRTRAFSGGICENVKDEVITLKATPDAVFDPIPFVCKEQGNVNITQGREINGLAGAGAYFGPGILPNGSLNTNIAGVGTHNLLYVYIASNGCLDTASQIIKIHPTPTLNLGPNLTVLAGGTKQITPVSISANVVSYLWTPATYLNNPTIPNPVSTPFADVLYTLRVTSDSGCTAKADIFVKVLLAPVVPNTFTPNGDGVNDRWEIKFLDTYPGATVEVYNRYGQPIFNVKNYQPWDGKLKGIDLPVGTYYYVVNPRNGRTVQTGYVTIIR